MKIKELANLSKEELIIKDKTLREELFKLSLQRYAGRVEKPHLFKIIRKDIARVQTLLKRTSDKKEKQDK
jgi:ribosomal protein L29